MKTLLALLFAAIAYGQQVDWVSQVRNKPMLDQRTFVWIRSPTSPSTLTASSLATVTLSKCPIGTAGSDTNHWIYIAGTGTAEWRPITGGTCTSGASTGTIQFTPGNNHTAGYTVGSPHGIYEAVAYGGAGSIITIPAGTTNACNLYIQSGVTLVGTGSFVGYPALGSGATNLSCGVASIPTLVMNATAVTVQNMEVSHSILPTSGGWGVKIAGNFPTLRNVLAINNYAGFYPSGPGGILTQGIIADSFATQSVTDGYLCDPTATGFQIDIYGSWATDNGQHGLNCTVDGALGNVTGPRLTGFRTYSNNGNGALFSAGVGSAISNISIQDSFFGSDNSDEIKMDTRGVQNVIQNTRVELAGQIDNPNVGYNAATVVAATHTGYGILATANNNPTTGSPLLISGVVAGSNSYSGMGIAAPRTVVVGGSTNQNGKFPANNTHKAGISVQDTDIMVTGVHFGAQNQIYGIEVNNAAPIATAQFGSNTFEAGLTNAIKFDQVVTAYSPQIAALQPQRFGASCTTAATVAAECTTAYTISPAFVDTNYTAVCSVNGVASGAPSTPVAVATSGSTLTVTIQAGTAAAAQASGVACIIMHD
jgi:hypothetical protein